MNCSRCRHVNAPERNFCGGCGLPLASFCPRCGFRNLSSDRFCGGCGSALERGARAAAAPPEPAGPPVPETAPVGDSALAELLQAAQEAADAETEPEEQRVSQDDIDALFGG
ncbi:zinc ribbon domain-containing protein [Deferrisoma camini]|uniref:zinc ribbon domain-containing protein n=1 Tax=Deferrisoma camini TaxID=1035120 RepID=UPI00046C9276|nr:zinc ribbon domain-containing protein [Deferrisoma camini]